MKNPVEYVIDVMQPAPSGGNPTRDPTGVAVLAEVTGVNRSTVGRWRRSGRIPVEYFGAILDWSKRARVEVSLKRLAGVR